MNDVLIVEDDRRHTGLIRIFLKDGDFNVIGTPTTGFEAVRILLDYVPDVVILDLRMPDGDGLKVMRVIEALEMRVPVIISTAVTDEATIQELNALGAADYLLKPYSSTQLLDSIKRQIVP